MSEKTKSMSHVKHIPKDAQVIMSIMKDMGITDYEPKVINQLLEFTYRKFPLLLTYYLILHLLYYLINITLYLLLILHLLYYLLYLSFNIFI